MTISPIEIILGVLLINPGYVIVKRINNDAVEFVGFVSLMTGVILVVAGIGLVQNLFSRF